MRRFLLASAAASGLMLAALPAFAQLPSAPLPANPPITTPAPNPDVAADDSIGADVQAPAAGVSAGSSSSTSVAPPRVTSNNAVTAQTTTAAPDVDEDVAEAPSPRANATAQAAPSANVQAPNATAQTTPRATAQAAPAPMPNAQVQAGANTGAQARVAGAQPSAQAGVQTAAAPANAGQVCQARTTSVHFGGGSALSRQNSNAIEQAADAASVCSLDNIVIASTGSTSTAARRADHIRALLVRQGVPEGKIRVEEAAADANSGTGQADIRMNFAGAASASTGATLEPTAMRGANAAASATTNVAANAAAQPRATAAPAPRAVAPAAPAPRAAAPAPAAPAAPAPRAATPAPAAPAANPTPDAGADADAHTEHQTAPRPN